MCEIAATPDDDKFTFVVDERYFTIKDLARLGLGRLAHGRRASTTTPTTTTSDPVGLAAPARRAVRGVCGRCTRSASWPPPATSCRARPDLPDHPQWPRPGSWPLRRARPTASSTTRARATSADRRADAGGRRARSPARGSPPPAASCSAGRSSAGGPRPRPGPRRPGPAAAARRQPAACSGCSASTPPSCACTTPPRAWGRAAGEAPGVVAAWTALSARLDTEQVGAITGEATAVEGEAAGRGRDPRRSAPAGDRGRRGPGRAARRSSRAALCRPEVACRRGPAPRRPRRSVSTTPRARPRRRGPGRRRDHRPRAGRAAAAPGRRISPAPAASSAAPDRVPDPRLAAEAEAARAAMIEALYHDARSLDKARLGRVDSVIGQKRCARHRGPGSGPPPVPARAARRAVGGRPDRRRRGALAGRGEYWAESTRAAVSRRDRTAAAGRARG